jgi:tryptophan halogenase
MPDLIRHVVIVGGDACASAVAACIANALRGSDTKITLLDDMSMHGGIASTLPPTVEFYNSLRFKEQSLIANTGATFKLGTEHSGWLQQDRRFVQSFGEHGVPIRLLPFYQYFLKKRLSDSTLSIDEFSLASSAGLAGRFSMPAAEDPESLQKPYQYGLHVNQTRFSAAMLAYATATGVDHIAAKAIGATVDSQTGFVDSVTLDGSRTIEGDFFVDCSGERGLLIGETLRVNYQSWADYLPCDRCVRITSNKSQDVSPLTRVIAKQHGWSRRVQTVERAEYEYFYNSATSEDDQVARQHARDTGAGEDVQPQLRAIDIGRRSSFWHHNCVAIGRSAGNMESLDVSSSSRAHSAAMRLVGLWPHADCNRALASQYNRLTAQEYEYERDFVTAFYSLSDRDDSDFWNHSKALKTSDVLDDRLALFRSHGRIRWNMQDVVSRDNWVSALLGLNCLPRACDPLVDVADPKLVDQFMGELREWIIETVDKMPAHVDFLRDLYAESGKASSAARTTSGPAPSR